MRRNGLVFVLLGIVAIAIVLPRFRGVAPKPGIFDDGWTLTEAKAKSASTGKPVLALLTADWCGPCQQLKRGTLSDEKVTAEVQRLAIPVYLDVDHSADDARQFANVSAVPTMIVQFGDQELGRISGVVSSKAFLAWLDASVAKQPVQE